MAFIACIYRLRRRQLFLWMLTRLIRSVFVFNSTRPVPILQVAGCPRSVVGPWFNSRYRAGLAPTKFCWQGFEVSGWKGTTFHLMRRNTIQESTTAQEYLFHVVSKLSIDYASTRFVGMASWLWFFETFRLYFKSFMSVTIRIKTNLGGSIRVVNNAGYPMQSPRSSIEILNCGFSGVLVCEIRATRSFVRRIAGWTNSLKSNPFEPVSDKWKNACECCYYFFVVDWLHQLHVLRVLNMWHVIKSNSRNLIHCVEAFSKMTACFLSSEFIAL